MANEKEGKNALNDKMSSVFEHFIRLKEVTILTLTTNKMVISVGSLQGWMVYCNIYYLSVIEHFLLIGDNYLF